MVTREARGGFVSLGTRLAVGTIVVLAIVSSLAFFQLARRERERTVEAKRVASSMVTALFATSVAAPLDFGDPDAVDLHLYYLRENPTVLRASVWPDGASAPIASTPPGILQSAPREVAEATELVRDTEVEALAPIVNRRGVRLGVARVVFTLAPENAALAANRNWLLIVSALLAGATGGLLLVLARRQIVAPLEKFARAARRVEAGATSAPVDVNSRDEIGSLARAWNAMGTAVEERERKIIDREKRLADANRSLRELLDHMRQAIVVMGADGRADDEQSRMAARIFGIGELDGRAVGDLIYPGREEWDLEAAAFRQWVGLAFSADPTRWSDVEALAPREVCLREGTAGASILELEFRPVVRDGVVARVMLLATEVTEERKLEGLVRNQQATHARQLATMRRLLGGGSQGFVEFLARAREQLDQCGRVAQLSIALVQAPLADALRDVHTLRGEAHAFDLADLGAEAGAIEAKLVELRALAPALPNGTAARVRAELAERVFSASEALNRSERLFVEMAPAGHLALEQVVVRRSDLGRLQALAGGRHDELGELVSLLTARPLGDIVDRLVDQTAIWAAQEGKKARFELDGREALLSAKLARVLPGVLTHLVRNAVAHGIERPEDRAAAGKPEIGTIKLACLPNSGAPRMTLSDDGAGIDARAVMAAAKGRGLPEPSTEQGNAIVDLLFVDGLTTRTDATELAGRGVGLSAVKRDLSAVGYDIIIESARGRGTTVILQPKIKPEPRGGIS